MTNTTGNLFPLQTIQVNRDVLVIGGGLAGVETAMILSERGFRVTLVEKESSLGGWLKSIHFLHCYSENPGTYLNNKVNQLKSFPNVEIYTNTTLARVEGFVGDFKATLQINSFDNAFGAGQGPTPMMIEKRVGAIVLAIGFQASPPDIEGAIESTGFKAVPTKLLGFQQVEELLAHESNMRRKSFSFVLDDETERFPLLFILALKNALWLREKQEAIVHVLFHQAKVAGENVDQLYAEARGKGIQFFRIQNKPQIESVENQFKIVFEEPFLGLDEKSMVELWSDFVVMPEHFFPSKDRKNLTSVLCLKGQELDFAGLDNPNYYNGKTSREGIFRVGGCEWPSTVEQVVSSATAVVSDIQTLLYADVVAIPGRIPQVNPEKCVVCLTCFRNCPHYAISIEHDSAINNLYHSAAKMHPLACKGCGICVAECPGKAIELSGYSKEHILAYL